MQYFVYITCGTSTLTNPARSTPELYDLLIKSSNVKDISELSAESKKQIDFHYESQIDIWQNYSTEDARKKSAELNSLLAWQEKNNIAASDCYCYLLHTDTVMGYYSASLVEEWLNKNGYMEAVPQKMESLSTLTLSNFEKGLSNLAQWAFENIPWEHTDSNVKYIFNVAGGFKSVSGFMQILGQFLADETIYLFEGRNNEILSMPRLPVQWSEIDTIREHFDDYHRISLGIPPKKPELLNALWVRENEFTPWGQIAWENAKQALYGEKVYDFICNTLIEGEKFRESVKGLDKLRNKMVNERLDDLARFIMSGKTKNVRRLDYKVVRGNYPWSHECDAWADGSARRLFCNDNGDKIVVECLGDALH